MLRADAVLSDEAWPKRMRQAKEMLRRGDPLDIAKIVRDGARRQQQLTASGIPFKLSAGERAVYLRARDSLSSEIGVVRGLGQREADAWIDEQLAHAGREGSRPSSGG